MSCKGFGTFIVGSVIAERGKKAQSPDISEKELVAVVIVLSIQTSRVLLSRIDRVGI